MKSASLSHGAGPGSTITLTAETIRVRDAIIEKFSDKSLPELNSFIETALGTEQDENKRLGILAARVYILRMRMQNIASFNSDPLQTSLSEVTPADLMRGKASQPAGEEASGEGNVSEEVYQEWNELTVIEAGEINGVRIPKGVTITVGIEDARRLIETNKAIFTKGSAESGEGAEAGRAIQPENDTEIERQAEDIAEASAGDIGTEETSVEEPTQTRHSKQKRHKSRKPPHLKQISRLMRIHWLRQQKPAWNPKQQKTEAGEETKDDDRADQQK